jgi:hypothetical protein
VILRVSKKSAAIAFVAIGGAIAYLLAFYPGAMSFDSAAQWAQVRGAPTDNVHGVGMVWLWWITDRVLPGPAGMFLLQTALFWSGLALIANSLRANTIVAIVSMLLAACLPVPFVLISHLWSDTLLMAVLTFIVGALTRAREQNGMAWLRVVWGLLFFALTLRHNALAAVFPLAIYAVYLSSLAQPHLRTHSPLRIAFFAAMLMQVSVWELEHFVDERRTLFAATAEWDLAAISLKVGTILLPSASHGPDLTLEDLSQAFVPYSNTTLFRGTRAGMRQPFYKIDDPLNDAVRDAWIGAIAAHPRAYLSHRWRVTRELLGTHREEWPKDLVYFDGEYAYATNPPVAPNTTAIHERLIEGFEAMRSTIALAAWPYIAIAIGALILAWRRRRADAYFAFAVVSSGLLYAAPLAVIAPAAELRYLGWTCVAAILGAALAFATPRASVTASDAYPPAP